MSSPSKLRWLHISDLHIKSKNVTEQEIVISALINSFKPGGDLANYLPDMIFCSGDIAFSGKPEEYLLAEKYIRELCKVCQINLSHFFLVPGNHDIDRERIPQFYKVKLENRDEATNFFLRDLDRRIAFQPLENYSQFYKNLIGEEYDYQNLYKIRTLNVCGILVGVLELNSAIFSGYDNSLGKIVIGESILRDAISVLKRSKEIDIVFFMVHHPYSWLSDFEQLPVERLTREICNVLLHGHLHNTNPYVIVAPEGKYAVHAVGAAFQGRNYPNNAYIVEVTNGTGRILPISFVDQGEGTWRLDGTVFGKSRSKNKFRIFSEKKTAATNKDNKGFDPSFLTRMLQSVKNIEVFTFLGASQKNRNNIDDVFVRLFVRYYKINLDENSSAANQPLDIIKVFRTDPFLVIIGSPGSGKTTTLKYITYHLLQSLLKKNNYCEKLGIPDNSQIGIPLFIRLSDLVSVLDGSLKTFNASTLINLIIKWGEGNLWNTSPSLLKKLFEQRKLTILLDSLDEIEEVKYRRKISKIIQLAADFLINIEGPGQIIVTSRPYAYNADCILGSPFIEVEIEEMSRDQIERFTELWCKAIHHIPTELSIQENKKAFAEFASLKSALWANEQFRLLTKTPVLLAIMAAIHHRYGHLSGSKAELYDEIVNILLDRFKDHPSWSPLFIKEILAEIAFSHFLQNDNSKGTAYFDRDNIIEQIVAAFKGNVLKSETEKSQKYYNIQAEDFLDQQELMAGLLLSKNSRQLTFIHRSFEEYLASWKLASLEEEEIVNIFNTKIEDLNWREIFQFAIGILEKQGSRRLLRIYNGILLLHLDKSTYVDRLLSVMQIFSDLNPQLTHPLITDNITMHKTDILNILSNATAPQTKRTAAATTLGWANLDCRIGWEDDANLILVPEGDYIAGATDMTALPLELPKKLVNLSAFRINRFPVTCSQFKEFLDSDEYSNPQHWIDGIIHDRGQVKSYDFDLIKKSNFPMAFVNWYEANAFCSWLNTKFPRTDGWRWHLPNQLQWEKAARGGMTIEDGKINENNTRKYPWGSDEKADSCDIWKVSRFSSEPFPVGCFPQGRGAYGTYDQAGSVWEWCMDPREMDESEKTNSGLFDKKQARIVKGGSWRGDIFVTRISYVDWVFPQRRLDDVGFRVIASAGE